MVYGIFKLVVSGNLTLRSILQVGLILMLEALLVIFIKWPIRQSEQVWFQPLLVRFIKNTKYCIYGKFTKTVASLHSKSHLAWSKASRQTKIFPSRLTFQKFRNYLPEVKVKIFIMQYLTMIDSTLQYVITQKN